MILILSRGHYCPKDHQQHLELAAFYPKIAVAYTKIVTISIDNILESNEFRDAVGAQWPFLSDSGRKVQKAGGGSLVLRPVIAAMGYNERRIFEKRDNILP